MGRRGNRRIALGAVFAAGSLAMLFLASAAPSGRIGLTAVAGLFPMAAVLAGGTGAGYLCWGAASLLALVLVPDKGVALMYALFLGIYPVVKAGIERLRRLPLELFLKLLFFNAVLLLFWQVLRALFLPNPPGWLTTPVLLVAGNVIFLVYDFGLSRLIGGLAPRLNRGRRGG